MALNWQLLSSVKGSVVAALKLITESDFDGVLKGLEQLASSTKRTEDVAMNLDKLLAAGVQPCCVTHCVP